MFFKDELQIFSEKPLAAQVRAFDGINNAVPDLNTVAALSPVKLWHQWFMNVIFPLPRLCSQLKFLLHFFFLGGCFVGNILDSMLLRASNKEAADSGKEASGSTASASSSQRLLWCHCYHHCPEDSTNHTCRYRNEWRDKICTVLNCCPPS